MQDFHFCVETRKSIDEVVVALETALKERGFGVLWEMDIPSKLQEKGVEFAKPYRILEVCNPHEAKEVLLQNELVGYFLPCKIVVYDHAGQTVIGFPKPTALMGIIADEHLMQTARRVEAALQDAVSHAAQ
ncbi:uncharacterized protein (DUF302 family) [Alicyclobacillus sacchari]|uniref:Uncharacterized protein (DUF302 family) n=1 Tax=Alicyclobacillus sacchari TaxID=392010 RepID=A0A4V3HEB8_9BACL|nr:DUF302 domain-containing protein [Alicyclobacillus sacchari]TDY45315.1 uncharacterized protein (DUF302 family) [Alicyclobacillus sacchari]